MNDKPKTDAAARMGLGGSGGPFGTALIEAARARPEIVGLSADLSKYTDMGAFAAMFPDRFIHVGMAEQNLVCVAAGLAQAGLTPVATTFGSFLTRRAQDFTVMQIALPSADVKLIGGLPGMSAGFGPSHTAVDDIAIMRAVPGMTVIDPCNTRELGHAMRAALAMKGPVYLRQPFARPGQEAEGSDYPFELGKAALLRAGDSVGIVASGLLVDEAMQAAASLEASGISAAVLKISTLKPFDGDAVAELAERTGRLVTAENHSVIGGLFSAVSEALAYRGVRARVSPVGVPDIFTPFGSLSHLMTVLGVNAAAVEKAALALIGKEIN